MAIKNQIIQRGSSEDKQKEELNRLQEKFSFEVFKKTKKEKRELKKAKMNLSKPFENDLILHLGSDDVSRITRKNIPHKERKLQERKRLNSILTKSRKANGIKYSTI